MATWDKVVLRFFLTAILLLSGILLSATSANAQSEPFYSLQVGAYGDTASIGNVGVGVQIQTQRYNVRNPGEADSFWAGESLNKKVGGSFIQFGYIIEPGHYCLQGHYGWELSFICTGSSENIGHDDARWFWQYFPNETGGFYYALGPAYSAGYNGTWHDYSIEPNATNYWSFRFDGRLIGSLSFQAASSNQPAFEIAEKTSNSTASDRLGPVEFRNLEYLKLGRWSNVSFLNAHVGCGFSSNCSTKNPYGVAAEGANLLVAGSGIPQPASSTILWTNGAVLTLTIQSLLGNFGAYVDNLSLTSGSIKERETSNITSDFQSPPTQFILQLPKGLHVITLRPGQGGVVRLKFDGWSDGFQSPNRTINLTGDMDLNAAYSLQFELRLLNQFGENESAASGAGWYDANTRANFSIPNSIHMQGVWGDLGGVYHFQGWYRFIMYDYNGNPIGSDGLVTSSTHGSIFMGGAHQLYVRWSEPDYTVPTIVIPSLVGFAVISIALFRKRKSKRSE